MHHYHHQQVDLLDSHNLSSPVVSSTNCCWLTVLFNVSVSYKLIDTRSCRSEAELSTFLRAYYEVSFPVKAPGICRKGAPNIFNFARKLVKIEPYCKRPGHSIFRDLLLVTILGQFVKTPLNGKCLGTSLEGYHHT